MQTGEVGLESTVLEFESDLEGQKDPKRHRRGERMRKGVVKGKKEGTEVTFGSHLCARHQATC